MPQPQSSSSQPHGADKTADLRLQQRHARNLLESHCIRSMSGFLYWPAAPTAHIALSLILIPDGAGQVYWYLREVDVRNRRIHDICFDIVKEQPLNMAPLRMPIRQRVPITFRKLPHRPVSPLQQNCYYIICRGGKISV